MRVLLPIIYHDLTHCIERAFKEAGHETLVVDWRKSFREKRRSDVEGVCLEAAKRFRPELAFCQFQTHGVIGSGLPQYIHSIGCFSINWAGDVRHPLPEWYMELAPFFDVTSFSNGTDVDLIRGAGHRSEFLQVGYDERVYNTIGAGERSGVVFLGNNYGAYRFAESESRRAMVQAMCEAFPDDFTVYGTAWEGVAPAKNCGGFAVEGTDADILRRSLVAVGYDHFHRPGFASDRLLRATACGCAVVNQYYDGIEAEHPYVGAASSIPDMVKMVAHALAHPEEARRIGVMNAAHTLKEHRWNNRVTQMMGWMEGWQAKPQGDKFETRHA